jgi:hypothetical protein
MQPIALTTLQGGINRLTVKGAASANRLYDLVNAYITNDGSTVPREGTLRAATLDTNSVGLMAVDGVFNIFGGTYTTSTATVPDGYQLNLLISPVNSTATPTKIWFAKPFMGFPFVTAQFSDGLVFDYWLQSNGAWTSETVYTTGSIVTPDVPNGLAYLAVRNFPQNPLWTADTTITSATIIEPNEYTGYAYKAISVAGTNPHTGASEPVWPTVSAGQIQEFGDFDTSSSDAGTTQATTTTSAQNLGGNITDRYGDSSTIAGQGTPASSSLTLPTTASTKVTTWKAGTLYAPGAVVMPTNTQGAFTNAIPNGDFEDGDDGSWDFVSSATNWAYSETGAYQGAWCISFPTGATQAGGDFAIMNTFGACTPGQSVTASAYLNPANSGANLDLWIQLNWYTSTGTFISASVSTHAENGGYRKVSVTGTAPSGATQVKLAIGAGSGTDSRNTGFADLCEWSLETPAAISNFLYEAVQSAPASSGTAQPVWPTIAGDTVIDGKVTWEAIGTSIITWEAIPLMQSGATEPVFSTVVGNSVQDPSTFTDANGSITSACSMSWECVSRVISDINDPQTIPTALGASHVFKGNKDIVSYSAAVNPTDFTTPDNAGYLPTGLNNYGDNPVAMLALYRSNLMAFNAGGYQMWQIDPDPANMAILDAQPIGSTWPRAAQSVANNLLLLTEVGVRDIGTIGATANMAIGSLGQPVDPLVKAQLNAGTYDPLSLYYPGRGQYWLIFGAQAFVLTINGQGIKAWSRYLFPDQITDWTLNGGTLYVRTLGNLVWSFTDQVVGCDDAPGSAGAENIPFNGIMQWPYLNAGVLGLNKMLVGIDIVGDGSVSIQVGFNQSDKSSFNDAPTFTTSTSVTAPYLVTIADTVPGEPIPIPCNAPSYSLILTFAGSSSSANAWTWEAANLYVAPQGGAGATG